jgi:hypothetical protein
MVVIPSIVNEITLKTQESIGGNGLIPPKPAVIWEEPPKRRVGRPAKTGMVTAPLFGIVGDYGPGDDAIYWAYPRKIKRPEAIKQIVLAVKRLTVKYRMEGQENPEKAARLFLINKVNLYAIERKKLAERDPRAIEFTPYPSTWFYQERYFDDDDGNPIGADNPGARIPPRGNSPGQRRTAAERGQFEESDDYSRYIVGHDKGGGGAGSNPVGANGDAGNGSGAGENGKTTPARYGGI